MAALGARIREIPSSAWSEGPPRWYLAGRVLLAAGWMAQSEMFDPHCSSTSSILPRPDAVPWRYLTELLGEPLDRDGGADGGRAGAGEVTDETQGQSIREKCRTG